MRTASGPLIIIAAVILIAIALDALASAAGAQVHALCGDRAAFVQQLEESYGETRVGVGVDRSGPIVEIFANRETGTWTLMITRADGVSCLIAAGDAWHTMAPRPLPSGDPA